MNQPYVADIRSIPKLETNTKFPSHPKFLLECSQVLAVATNLQSFTCTPSEILPSFLPPLQTKERLTTLRINGALTIDQTAMLLSITGLKSLTIEEGSWTVVDSLPKWAEKLKETLAYLTIDVS